MPNGILILDKPSGWTSMDVCAKLRGILGERRIGHAGTLDPMATGVLPVFVGQATKVISFAENGEKEYLAGLQLGIVTDTQDTEGSVLRRQSVSVSLEELAALLPRFTGEIAQIPPMYSALKRDGRKLYELARKGIEVERAPRPITIHALEVLAQDAPDRFLLRVRCSKGTYVRTLCHDLGEALGVGGCMFSLRRSRAAGFTLEQSVTLEQVREQGAALLTPLDAYFRQYPAFPLPHPRMEQLCRCGNPLRVKLPDGIYRVYGQDGTFLCLSQCENGILTSLKNFFGA